jgi:hypothetical protein
MNTSLIASIITAEFYRPILIVSLLSKIEANMMIVNVSNIVAKELDGHDIEKDNIINTVNTNAKKIIFENYNIKL